jgi:hypothetical protein
MNMVVDRLKNITFPNDTDNTIEESDQTDNNNPNNIVKPNIIDNSPNSSSGIKNFYEGCVRCDDETGTNVDKYQKIAEEPTLKNIEFEFVEDDEFFLYASFNVDIENHIGHWEIKEFFPSIEILDRETKVAVLSSNQKIEAKKITETKMLLTFAGASFKMIEGFEELARLVISSNVEFTVKGDLQLDTQLKKLSFRKECMLESLGKLELKAPPSKS